MSADFVCLRGVLKVLMCTPYEKNEDWIICATKWKGTIFLCAKETERKRLSNEQMTDRDKQFSSWGFKFEQYMSSGNFPDILKILYIINGRFRDKWGHVTMTWHVPRLLMGNKASRWGREVAAANILNNQPWKADKRWLMSSGVE